MIFYHVLPTKIYIIKIGGTIRLSYKILKIKLKKGVFKMNVYKTKNAVAVVKNKKGKIIGYLTEKHEEQGIDIQLNMQGYTVEAL